MAYQTADTQPERTALAWARTSLALFAGTIWVCRAAFLDESPLAALVLAISFVVVVANFFALRARKKTLRKGLELAPATGIANLLVVAQLVLVATSALLIDFSAA
jgi:uncharacterized membrane protein YidH (DUF202 family)